MRLRHYNGKLAMPIKTRAQIGCGVRSQWHRGVTGMPVSCKLIVPVAGSRLAADLFAHLVTRASPSRSGHTPAHI
jgi:hypothetical protein